MWLSSDHWLSCIDDVRSPTRVDIASNCGLDEMNQMVIVMPDSMMAGPFGDVPAVCPLGLIEKRECRGVLIIAFYLVDDIVGELWDPV